MRGATSEKQQRGVVLIIALLIVAVVTGLAVNLSFWFNLHLAKVENRWYGSQASAYMDGAESLAIMLLSEDDENSDTDDLSEQWAQDMAPFAIDGGWLKAGITDAQRLLDLNTLDGEIDDIDGKTGEELARSFTEPQRQFIRLLQSFEEEQPIDTSQAIEILQAVVDWMDADSDVSGSGGAETYFYQQEEVPYQPANQQFYSVSELLMVRNVTPELYELISPWLVALPSEGSRHLNLNTMPAQLLRVIGLPTVLTPLSEDDAATLDVARISRMELEGTGFEKVDTFLETSEAVSVFGEDAESVAGIDVATDYFTVTAEVTINDQRRSREALLQRSTNGIVVLQRSGN